jgi:conjugal transfer mating pair stabilization protein TraN
LRHDRLLGEIEHVRASPAKKPTPNIRSINNHRSGIETASKRNKEQIMIKSILKQVSVYCTLTLFLFSPSVLGRTCEIIAQECLDGPSVKDIDGYMVAKECWKFKNTMSCYDEDAYDNCAPLDRTPGCNRVKLVQNDDGTLTSQYKCTNENISDPKINKLEESYTIGAEETSPECANFENNPSCRRGESVCVGANGLRVQNITNPETDCASWRQNYVCQVTDQKNFCGPLASAGCQQVQSECSRYSAETGVCDSLEVLYSCSEDGVIPEIIPENIIKLDETYTLSRDGVVNACTDNEQNPNCFLAQEVCTEGAETRLVDGVRVYNDCWQWERKYACLSDIPRSSDCQEYEDNVMCTQTGTKCLDEYYVNGRCQDIIREYKCETGQKEAMTVQNCGGQTWCDDMGCWNTGYTPDNDIGRVLAGLTALQQFGYQIFLGEPHWCIYKKSWGLNNCCKKNPAYRDFHLREVATQAGIGFATGAIGAMTTGVSTTSMVIAAATALITAFERGGNRYQTTQYVMNAIVQVGAGIAGAIVVTAALEGALLTTSWCWVCVVVIVILIIIAMVVGSLMECDDESVETSKLIYSNACYKVGEFCSKRSGNTCREKKRGYCCFASTLSKVVNIGGRAQLGIGWGSAEHPDCRAFTEEEFSRLDFDQMDLSEFMDEIIQWSKTRADSNARMINRGREEAERMAEEARRRAEEGMPYSPVPWENKPPTSSCATCPGYYDEDPPPADPPPADPPPPDVPNVGCVGNCADYFNPTPDDPPPNNEQP